MFSDLCYCLSSLGEKSEKSSSLGVTIAFVSMSSSVFVHFTVNFVLLPRIPSLITRPLDNKKLLPQMSQKTNAEVLLLELQELAFAIPSL